MKEEMLPLPFEDDIELDEHKIAYLVVEDDGTGMAPKICGVYEESEYLQARANASSANKHVIGVIMNRNITEEELSHVED